MNEIEKMIADKLPEAWKKEILKKNEFAAPSNTLKALFLEDSPVLVNQA